MYKHSVKLLLALSIYIYSMGPIARGKRIKVSMVTETLS